MDQYINQPDVKNRYATLPGGSEYEPDEVVRIFEKGIQTDRDRCLMGQSLLYGCCGKDPTPIVALGGKVPLYVYCDLVKYGNGCFEEETRELYDRLTARGFTKEFQTPMYREKYTRTNAWELTAWHDPEGKPFYLAYLQGYVSSLISLVYYDPEGVVYLMGKGNRIQPPCVCNIVHEEFRECRGGKSAFEEFQERAEYIFGHCFSEKYQKIATFDYLGDYSPGAHGIGLYKRKYWYVY